MTWWWVGFVIALAAMSGMGQLSSSRHWKQSILSRVVAAKRDHIIFHEASRRLFFLSCFWGIFALGFHWAFTFHVKPYFGNHQSEAFGPFATIMGLLYSVMLGQIYCYYFDRQGVIQDSIYRELATLQHLTQIAMEACKGNPRAKEATLRVLLKYSIHMLNYCSNPPKRDSGASDLISSDFQDLYAVVSLVEQTSTRAIFFPSEIASSIRKLGRFRSERMSAADADLPPVQRNGARITGTVFLAAFLFTDFGQDSSEGLAATLWAISFGTFTLINLIIDDLSDPFSGNWNAAAGLPELRQLIGQIDTSLQLVARQS